MIAVLDTTAFSAAMRYEETPEASRLFGAMKAHLEHSGTPIDDFDILIAAIAGSHGAEVITANLAHFVRIPGITARHWQ